MSKINKILAFIMALIMSMICISSTVIAAKSNVSDEAPSEPQVYLPDNSVTYTCYYNKETNKIDIAGTVDHDIMISHEDYMIEFYKIPIGSTFESAVDTAKPFASTSIVVRFQFSLKVEQAADRFCSYAIALRGKDGSVILAAEPQLASVESEYSPASDNSSYKGISSEYTSVGGDLGCGTAIIPISLDSLISKVSNGYLYKIDQSHIYFDDSYIDKLDATVRTYCADGCRVYFQFLISADAPELSIAGASHMGAKYSMPNIYSPDAVTYICAISEFLSDRYNSYQSGQISGIIVGKTIDYSASNYCGGLSLDELSKMYALYLSVVANSARLYNPSLDIVIPFSALDSYSEHRSTPINYSPAELLESILGVMDKKFCIDFSCTTMIESDITPLQITNASLSMPIETGATIDTDKLCVENISIYSTYLSSLQGRFGCAPKNYMFVWNVPAELSGNALSCAYTYAYYTLISMPMLSSFIVSFEYAEAEGKLSLLDLKRVIKNIDTSSGLSVTNELLSYFDKSSWTEIVPNMPITGLVSRTLYSGEANVSKMNFKGSFSYFDFSSGDVSGWFSGMGSSDIRADYAKEGVRALKTSLALQEGADHSDVLCLYEYPENFAYTSHLKLSLSLNDDTGSSSALYHVIVNIGNSDVTLTSEHTVSANTDTELWINMSEFNNGNAVDYIKISVRRITGNATACSLWIYGVTGHSALYSSEQISEFVRAERLRIRNQSEDTDDGQGMKNTVWIIFGILIAVTCIGAGLFMVFAPKRDDNATDGDREECDLN